MFLHAEPNFGQEQWSIKDLATVGEIGEVKQPWLLDFPQDLK